MQLDPKTYLRSPSTSGRSFVIAITNANNVTKVVMKTTGELQVEIQEQTYDKFSKNKMDTKKNIG